MDKNKALIVKIASHFLLSQSSLSHHFVYIRLPVRIKINNVFIYQNTQCTRFSGKYNVDLLNLEKSKWEGFRASYWQKRSTLFKSTFSLVSNHLKINCCVFFNSSWALYFYRWSESSSMVSAMLLQKPGVDKANSGSREGLRGFSQPSKCLLKEGEGRGFQLVATCYLRHQMPLNPTPWSFKHRKYL